jgi:hypothetical protein
MISPRYVQSKCDIYLFSGDRYGKFTLVYFHFKKYSSQKSDNTLVFIFYFFVMKILNTLQEDYHIHSINFSDGFNTIDEIVQFAGKIGLKKIVITDHSQADLDIEGISHRCYRTTLKKRKNEYNDVDVSFGIE